MAPQDLRGDGAAEGEAVQDGRKAIRTDGVMEFRRGDAVIDRAAQRRAAGAQSESAIVEEEAVVTGVEKVRHDLGDAGDVAGVAVTPERRGDRLLRAQVPGEELL